ncbi:MAG: tRNA lysidine(34) synthetase TilS [Lachnospiraceae bacterium]
MIDKIQEFMEQYGMIQSGDHVLVGVSGGADSLCLLYLLQELTRIWKFKISVLHVEHGIRGEDSVKDMEFVQKICRDLEIPCRIRHFDVPSIAKKKGLSEEEAGRQVRYQAFEEEAAVIGANKIAVAHHANDLAETMLFFLCRGTGLSGLTPMQPVRGNILRPLLCVSREEIEEYLEQKGLEYCKDVTNLDTDYARNKIRHEVMPVLEQINPKAVEHFLQTARIVNRAEQVLAEQVQHAYLRYVEQRKAGLLLKQELEGEKFDYLVCEVIRKAMETLSESRKDISRLHVEQVQKLFQLQVGRSINLPYGIKARRTYEGVWLESVLFSGEEEEKGQNRVPVSEPVKVPGTTLLEDGSCFQCRLLEENHRAEGIPTKQYTKWMDYDIIKDNFSVRRPEAEDYIVIDDRGSRKKLKKLFTDEKIPREKRGQIPVLARGDHVFWAVGVRMGEDVKITAATRQVVEISFYQEGERTDE